MKSSTQGPPPYHLLKFGRLSLWLATGICLTFSPVMAAEPAANDPQPPDVLDLVITGAGKTADWMNVEAVLKPNIDAQVELEVEAASGAKLADAIGVRVFGPAFGQGEDEGGGGQHRGLDGG